MNDREGVVYSEQMAVVSGFGREWAAPFYNYLLTQIGWRSHIQSIVTENNLICWYEKAMRGKYAEQIGDELIIRLCGEIAEEFPSVDTLPDIIKNRHYEKAEIDDFWKVVE